MLKYLLGTISGLRKQLQIESDVAGGGVKLLAGVLREGRLRCVHSYRQFITIMFTSTIMIAMFTVPCRISQAASGFSPVLSHTPLSSISTSAPSRILVS